MSKRKEELLKELQDLEALESEESVTQTTDESVADNVQATKKPRSQKQIEAFNKACETRKANEAKRKEDRIIKELQEKQILEGKLVKQAIAIKRRQLQKEKIIDQIAEEPKSIQAPKADKIIEQSKLTFRFY